VSMSRGALLTLTEEMADAVGSSRWGATLKRQLLGEVHWREWRDLLNVNRMLRVAKRTVTTDAEGQFAKAALNSGSGDATEKYYRLLSIRAGNRFYQQAQYEEYPLSPTIVLQPNVWYEYGDKVQVIPSSPVTELEVVVNHLPQRADLLVDDSSLVVFPDSYELILAYETAASMLTKGAAETQLANELRGSAMALRDRMGQDLARRSQHPLRMRAADDPADWGCY